VVRENERVEEAVRQRKNEVNHVYIAHPCSHEVSMIRRRLLLTHPYPRPSNPLPSLLPYVTPSQSDRLMTSLEAESQALREEVRQAREQSAESDRQVPTALHCK
jgi:hypothetical protein